MEYKHAIAVDSNGYKLEFVLVEITEQESDVVETVMHYELTEGAKLVYDDIPTALEMLKPRWYRKKWQETATEEELAERDAALEAAQPDRAQPYRLDLVAAELTKAMEAMQLQNDKAIAELSMARIGGVGSV